LRQHLNEQLADVDPDLFVPSLEVDSEIELGDLTEQFVGELQLLEPHGQANRQPQFLIRGLEIAGKPRLVGMKGQHIIFYLSNGDVSYKAIAFRMGEQLYDKMIAGARRCSVVSALKVDTWSGTGEVELHVRDVEFE